MTAIACVPKPNAELSPAKFAHVVLRTNNLEGMRDWYKSVLGAELMFENDSILFLTYDDEHHRIALIKRPGLGEAVPNTVGVDHFAFAYPTLGDLVSAYESLKAQGIVPHMTVNHGTSTSMYFHDPDGNGVELQVDNFDTIEELNEWFAEGGFTQNQLGTKFDMDEMAAKFHAGVPEAELLYPPQL